MTGILVQLALSWLIIWLADRNNLRVLGFSPTIRRTSYFFLLLIASACCCAIGIAMRMMILHQTWVINPVLDSAIVLKSIWWNIKSVLFEELIFRGVLLFILIKKIGYWKGIFISAIAFGMYHWSSFGVMGNPVAMIYVFLLTGLMGIAFAYGYARSLSLYLPIAIHFGWNFTQGFIFSQSNTGNGVFILINKTPVPSYLQLLPMLLLILISFLLIRTYRQEALPAVRKSVE